MAYFNDNDNLYSASIAPQEFELYPSLQSQTLAITEEDYNAMPTFVDGWSPFNQPGYSTVASTDFPAAPAHGLASAADSYQILSHGSYWPTTNQSPNPDQAGTLNWENVFASAQELETATSTITYDPVPADSWGFQRFEPTDVSLIGNVTNHHPPRPDLRRSYGTYHACPSMDGSAEAGPSTQPIQDDAWPTPQPTGGNSETAANAETNNNSTEEDETPAPRTRRPNGQGVPRPHRDRNRSDILKLQTWAKGVQGSRRLPTHLEAITVAAEVILARRRPVYDEDRLFRGNGRRTGVGLGRADRECERRIETRQVYQMLSRYYPLEGRSTWTTTQLLPKVLKDLNIP